MTDDDEEVEERRTCRGCGSKTGCDGTIPGKTGWRSRCLGGLARRADDERWAAKRATRWGAIKKEEGK